MDESKAEALADIIGGTWNSGGEMWLVLLKRSDGRCRNLGCVGLCVLSRRWVGKWQPNGKHRVGITAYNEQSLAIVPFGCERELLGR
jgi:hypothetical protein